MATVPTSTNMPAGDFVTSALIGALTSASTSATIGAGLALATTNGILQLDYDSVLAVGVDSGPETIFYTSYNSGSGAVTGITRGYGDTTAVAHANSATIQAAPSTAYWNNLADVVANSAWTAFTSVTTGWSGTPTQNNAYMQIGKSVMFRFAVSGTSNTTGVTMTLPIAAKLSTNNPVVRCTDSGTVSNNIGVMVTTTSTVATSVFRTQDAGTAWTNTGTKAVEGTLVYDAA